MTWADLLARWPLIECDLHDVYGIDLDDDRVMTGRTWRWLRTRIVGLLDRDSALLRDLTPAPRLPPVT